MAVTTVMTTRVSWLDLDFFKRLYTATIRVFSPIPVSKEDTYRGKDEKYRSKDDNFRGNDEKGRDSKEDSRQKDDFYNRNKERQPYQPNSYNKFNNPRYNSSQPPQGNISSRPPPNYSKPHDQTRTYNNNRPTFKPQENPETRYNQRREPYHPKSNINNNFKKQDSKPNVSDVTDSLGKMSVTSSPPQPQFNQQHKREDKRDDRNKVKNYPYDPCKIVGFQNKETNDFALSMLKAQGMQPPPEEHLPHDTIAVTAPNPMPQMPIQVQSPPQPNTFMAMPIYNAPTIHGHPSVQMQAIATTPMGEYQWNIGDHCLAKYWDDEKVCFNLCSLDFEINLFRKRHSYNLVVFLLHLVFSVFFCLRVFLSLVLHTSISSEAHLLLFLDCA